VSSEEAADILVALWRKWRSRSPVGRGAVTREQYWIMKKLRENGPMKVKDVAKSIGCTAGSASVAIKRLEKGGMVKRERSSDDERVVRVSLRKGAAEKLDSWRRDQFGSMSGILGKLTASDRRLLVGILGKALSESEKTAKEAGPARVGAA
jgi:DNA-binding MarR family transcriptional regulator